jgi:ribosomal protein L11
MKYRLWLFVGLVGLLVAGLGYGPLAQQTIAASAVISNLSCRGGVQIVQLSWLQQQTLLATQLFTPPVVIPVETKREFKFELRATPTALLVRGAFIGAQGQATALELTVPVGQETKYECGTILATVAGQQPQPPTGQPPLPPGLPPLMPGMSPQQLISALQAAGATVEVQGSQDKPKIGNADDPLILGALGFGFQAVGYWVSSVTGQLRVALTHDRPAAQVVLWVVGLPTLATCFSVPPLGGGLTLFCDRPALFAPFTTFNGGPVPGFVFFVLVIKVIGPTMPFVLSLAG